MTVVGLARSVSETADAWVTPGGVAALPASPAVYQMLYRLDDATTTSQVDDGRDAVTATVPAGAVVSARSWLTVKKEANSQTSLFVPFLMTFGGLGVLMAVLIIGNVIAGAVGTTTRRIGILKALGFTPSQVVRAYVAQALIPAAVGAVLGVVVGNLLAVPVLADTEDLYGTVALTIAPWVDVVGARRGAGGGHGDRVGRGVPGRPARTVDVLAVGRTPTAGRGRYAARVAARLPLPRPVTLGLAHPFSARPARRRSSSPSRSAPLPSRWRRGWPRR